MIVNARPSNESFDWFASRGAKGSSDSGGGIQQVNYRIDIAGAAISNPSSAIVDNTSADKLVFFNGNGASLYEITQSGTNAYRADNLLTIGGNPDQLTLSGANYYFVRDSGGGRQLALTDRLTTSAITTLPIGTNPLPQDLTDASGTLYFTVLEGLERKLYRTTGGTPEQITAVAGSGLQLVNPTRLTAVGTQLFFHISGQLWVVDNGSNEAVPFVDSAAATEVTASAWVTESTESPIGIVANGSDGAFTLQFDVTDAVREALLAGNTSVTVLVNAIPGTHELVMQTDGQFSTSGTGLHVTSIAQGVRADLLDAKGLVLGANQSVFDLSTTPAGTYYLGVFNPHRSDQVTDLPFSIEVNAPILGQPHPSTDRDVIRGGDGDDRIVGSGGLDRIFGDSGSDLFRSFSNEVRDLELGAGDAAETPGSADINDSPIEVEALPAATTDPRLRAAIARALGRPVTTDSTANRFLMDQSSPMNWPNLSRLDLSAHSHRQS